jgi:phosphoribosylamine---glycine ligase
MNILLIGSGGREHALAWKIAQSKKLSKLYIAPGNAGTAVLGTNVDIKADDFVLLGSFTLKNHIDMIVVGPEDPLVKGIRDYFNNDEKLKTIPVIGPGKQGAMLEGSKEFAKAFMFRHNIPTAGYFTVTPDNLNEGIAFLDKMNAPYVLKADGLAAGKGVLILDNLGNAIQELKLMLEGKFGTASRTVVIEEFLSGIELSVFVLTDGNSYKILPEAKDYKRVGEGDTGLNTGGMGAISPVPFANRSFLQKVEERIVIPTVEGLKKDNIFYQGFIFIGLMNCDGDPYVVEYNVRMGDPESEVVLPRIKTDIIELFEGVADQTLSSKPMEIEDESAATVMLVSGGYPEAYEKGKVIKNLDKVTDSIAFHAGTGLKEKEVVTNGGRVIAITSLGKDFKEALEKSYKNVSIIDFDKKYYRKDIGFDL